MRIRVLLVEDNPDSRDMLQTILTLDGFQVEVAEDGQQGLDAILAQRPDVALIDIGLPKLDGYEVARRVRRTARQVRGSPGGTYRLWPGKGPRSRVPGRVRRAPGEAHRPRGIDTCAEHAEKTPLTRSESRDRLQSFFPLWRTSRVQLSERPRHLAAVNSGL